MAPKHHNELTQKVHFFIALTGKEDQACLAR